MNDVRVDFGKHLRKLRKNAGYSQEELADRAKLHPTYVGQIERGLRNPSLINLHKLARALSVTSKQLFPF